MALNYGFGLYRKGWGDKEYKVLNKFDKEFYNRTLPYLLEIANIGILTSDTIQVVLSRGNLFYNNIMNNMEAPIKKKYRMSLPRYLRRFIGYEVNVIPLSNADYLKRYKDILDNLAGKFTKKKALAPVFTKDILAQREKMAS